MGSFAAHLSDQLTRQAEQIAQLRRSLLDAEAKVDEIESLVLSVPYWYPGATASELAADIKRIIDG